MQPAKMAIVAVGAVAALAALAAQESFVPAQLIAGALPTQPLQAAGGGEVLVELGITATGAIDRVRPLRTTAAFTDPTIEVLQGWRFAPATDVDARTAQRRRVPSTVLVAGVFRPPALTNGSTVGEPPQDVAAASDGVPFPMDLQMPAFPPRALNGGVVLVEVRVDAAGRVTEATVIRSAPPFDEPALEAARRSVFRPARLQARPVATIAYVIYGFRQPITVKPVSDSERKAPERRYPCGAPRRHVTRDQRRIYIATLNGTVASTLSHMIASLPPLSVMSAKSHVS
jgi:TonB family protein